jgi:F-type H+-transporting ATPase subunit gamma
MANLLDLKGKINSTKNTGQITKALQLVSASRQKKASDFLTNSRYMRNGLQDLISNIMKEVETIKTSGESVELPALFRESKSNKSLVIAVMSQRGLCGSINSSLFFSLVKFKKELGQDLDFISVNKMAQKYLKTFKESIISYFSDIPENPDTDNILPLITFVKENYSNYKNVYIAYSDFIRTGTIEPRIIKLLPIRSEASAQTKNNILYTIEPDPITILETLGNLYIDLEIYEAILSSQTAEHSSRMVAMQKASDNVKEITKTLTLKYNKARQAKITQAMAEISSNI